MLVSRIVIMAAERDMKAFELAADVTKQMITLSTGVIALTVAFSKDFLLVSPATVQGQTAIAVAAPWGAKLSLAIAYVCFLICIGLGLATMARLTSLIQDTNLPKVTEPLAFWLFLSQSVSFGLGLISTAIYGGIIMFGTI